MKKRRIVSFIAVIVWMSLLFFLSHQPATESGALSKGITQMVVSFLEWIFPSLEVNIEFFHSFVRKAAHFMGYFVLGLLVIHAVNRTGVRKDRRMLIALLICVAYAIFDEIHQLFVPGRAGQVADVIIDSTGALAGILTYIAFSRLRKRNTGENRFPEQRGA